MTGRDLRDIVYDNRGPDTKRAHSLARSLALRGKQVSRTEFVSDVVPYCDNPVQVVSRSHPREGGPTLESSMQVYCGKCEKCLQFRQMQWRERCLAELQQTHNANRRSWWGTLTFDSVMLAGILSEATLRARGPYSDREVDWAAYQHLQRYFKRLRAAGAKFRYFAVFERGEEKGRPHYHLLLHEKGPRPVVHSQLAGKWPAIEQWRLVDMSREGLAGYLTKYATKSIDTRLRASRGYGLANKGPGGIPSGVS